MDLAQIKEQLDGLAARQESALATIENGSATPEQVEEVKGLVNDLSEQMTPLREAHEKAMREEEFKGLKTQLTTLEGAIAELRKAPAGFFPEKNDEEGKALDEHYGDGKRSYFSDLYLATRNHNPEARERMLDGLQLPRGMYQDGEGKAMTEGVAAQGGYLVRPLIERQLVEAKELDNVLRPLCSKVNVNTNSIQLDQLTLSTTAGWVPETTAKPEGTAMTLATVTAAVHTAAGLATISNQLLADSNPAVDGLVVADLAKRLVALEETAMIAGTGTNQPFGILNTPGVTATTVATTPIDVLLDALLDSIAKVETAHGAPTAILMHPRTWTRIIKAKAASGVYYLGPNNATIPDVTAPRTGQRGPAKTLWGYPVITTNRMPTNLGTGTNESRIIVGDFSEALILDRQGITVDESSHVYFTTNQTVFRAEMRMGFTAARTPAAFDVIGGAGLANG
jgi:HK97 family phage major capsid protein